MLYPRIYISLLYCIISFEDALYRIWEVIHWPWPRYNVYGLILSTVLTVHRLSTFIIFSNLLICYLFIARVTYLISLLSIVEVWSSWDDKVSPTVFSLGYLLSSYSYWLPLQSCVYQSSHVIDLWNFCFRWRQMVIH